MRKLIGSLSIVPRSGAPGWVLTARVPYAKGVEEARAYADIEGFGSLHRRSIGTTMSEAIRRLRRYIDEHEPFIGTFQAVSMDYGILCALRVNGYSFTKLLPRDPECNVPFNARFWHTYRVMLSTMREEFDAS